MSSPDSAVRCLTSSFSVAPSASCEYRSFQCWLVPSHPKCNEFMFCRQKIWAKDSNVHDGMASEVPCTDLFEIKTKNQKPSISKIQNEHLLQFERNFKQRKTNISWLGKVNQSWRLWNALTSDNPREVEMWRDARDTQGVSKSIEFPASHRGCPWHSTQRLVATRSLRHNTSNSLTTVKKHVLSWEGNCKVRRNKCYGNVWRPRSMHKWWEGWPGPHPETSLAKKTELWT